MCSQDVQKTKDENLKTAAIDVVGPFVEDTCVYVNFKGNDYYVRY